MLTGIRGIWFMAKEIIPCKLMKHGEDNQFLSMDKASVMNWGGQIASTICARYYKGIGSHGDNMVAEVITDEQGSG